MSEQSQAGKIQTVLGLIEPESLGITMTHEHLLIDLTNYFEAPAEASQRGYIHRPVTIDILSDIRRVWKYNIDNLQLLDEQAAIEEVLKYKYAGGNAIVDATSIGIGRDPLALARISRATGLNVIMGASYYVPSSHPPDMGDRTESEIANEIISDLTVGVGETGIRSGVIGEIGCWWPPGPNEPKILRASAYAQSQTGAPILIHPGYHNKAHDKIMATLIEGGADPKNVIMGHLDTTQNDMGALKSLAETGCFMEYDTFGSEDTSHSALSNQERVSDAQRLDRIQFLTEQGHLDQILVAQDVCTKSSYTRYGGKGYAHILNNIVPRLRRKGFSNDDIHKILVDNPQRALAFK